MRRSSFYQMPGDNVHPLVDTGLHTQTSGRVKSIRKYIGDETSMLAYGDAVLHSSFTLFSALK